MVEGVERVCPEVGFDPIPDDWKGLPQTQIGVEELRSTQAVTRSDLESDRSYISSCSRSSRSASDSARVGEDVNAPAGQLLEMRSRRPIFGRPGYQGHR